MPLANQPVGGPIALASDTTDPRLRAGSRRSVAALAENRHEVSGVRHPREVPFGFPSPVYQLGSASASYAPEVPYDFADPMAPTV